MEKYKKAIQTRKTACLAVLALAAVLLVYDVFFAAENLKTSWLFGFQMGVVTAMAMFSVVCIVKITSLLRDKNKLVLHYNLEKDERLKAIRAKAGMPMLMVTSLLLLVAGMVAAYSSMAIFIALTAAAVGQLLLSALVKLYYMRTM